MQISLKKGAGIIAAVFLCGILAIPQIALAVDIERTYKEGEQVPATIDENGATYHLKSWATVDDDKRETKEFTKTSTKTLTAEEFTGDPRAAFIGKLAIDEDGYRGAINIVDARAEEQSAHTEMNTVERYIDFELYTQEDVNMLPQELDSEHGALPRISLNTNPVDTGYGQQLYNGRATYRGSYEERIVDTYLLTATYKGSLTKGNIEKRVKAVYEKAATTTEVVSSSSEQPTTSEQQPVTQPTITEEQAEIAAQEAQDALNAALEERAAELERQAAYEGTQDNSTYTKPEQQPQPSKISPWAVMGAVLASFLALGIIGTGIGYLVSKMRKCKEDNADATAETAEEVNEVSPDTEDQALELDYYTESEDTQDTQVMEAKLADEFWGEE